MTVGSVLVLAVTREQFSSVRGLVGAGCLATRIHAITAITNLIRRRKDAALQNTLQHTRDQKKSGFPNPGYRTRH